MFWWKNSTQKKFASIGLLTKLAPNISVFKSVLKLLFFILGISFLILALINPKIGTKLKTVKREGVDVVFALDVSKSMLAEDIAPNRLEKSKQIISKIIDKLGSDRVGIIIYAGNAYPLLPITTDHGAAKMFLQNANPDLVSSQGTAINEALDLAKTYYNNDEQTNRFLIIISDGEDHQEETKQLAQNISNDGIKVYTIGVGSEKGGPIPMKINGSLIGYKKYKGEAPKDELGVIEVYKLHNARIKKLIGIEIKQVTYSKYLESGKHLQDFIKHKFKARDICFNMLKSSFLDDYEYFLKTEKKLQQSTLNKAIQRFRKVVKYAIAEDYLLKDPFILFRYKTVKKK